MSRKRYYDGNKRCREEMWDQVGDDEPKRSLVTFERVVRMCQRFLFAKPMNICPWVRVSTKEEREGQLRKASHRQIKFSRLVDGKTETGSASWTDIIVGE